MFDSAEKILHAITMESYDRQDKSLHPLLLFSHVFCDMLSALPAIHAPFPGCFGLDECTPGEQSDWERRIAMAAGRDITYADPTPESLACRQIGFMVQMDAGHGHTTVDFAAVLTHGLKYYYEQVQGDSPFDKAVAESLLAVKAFAERYGRRVPWEPAANFDEAIDSIWLTYECIVISEHVPWSYSWGRMDQYLLPFVKSMSRAEMTEKFIRFFRFLNQFPIIDAASALNLGGPDGFNDISRAIIDAVATLKMPSPLLTVRISRKLTEEDLMLTLRKELLCCGQPTFYGEEACRAALAERGLPPEDIDNWAANSCMGITIPGREWQNMWGTVILMPFALEMALNNGRLLKEVFPVEHNVPSVAIDEYADFEALYQQVMKYIRFFFDFSVAQVRINNARTRKIYQNAFVSVFYDDSIGRKKEVRDGGAVYMDMIVETMGMVNLADSLYSIRRLVFDEHKYSLADIAKAMGTDFEGIPELLADIKRLPKYGQNDPQVDALVVRITEDCAGMAKKLSDEHFFCTPSLHTLDTNIPYGTHCAASPDGRRSGSPLAKNAGTRPDVSVSHTSLLLSATAWNQAKYSGGQPVDLWIDPSEWSTLEGRRKYAGLMKVFFERGGLQLQVNGADPNVLRDAIAHREKYPDLYVKIGGYSARFASLSRDNQLDFIARFSAGM